MRDLVVGEYKTYFFSRKTWDPDTIEKKKSAAGYFNVSSAELTALDFMSSMERLEVFLE